MKLNGVIPVIEVENVERQLEFYQQAFRFIVINKRVGPSGLEWVHLRSDNTWLMLQKNGLSPYGSPASSSYNHNITLYYYTDDVLSNYRYMKAKGIAVGELSATEYGMMEYQFYDPEGNKLAVGQIKKD
jgi:uncharacterized glyoxalase superfamily protein PhnB